MMLKRPSAVGLHDLARATRCYRASRLICLATALACALSSMAAAAADEPSLVTVAETTLAPLVEELPYTASVTSERDAALSPRVSGLVQAVHVDAGDRVAAGKILVQLDASLARLALQRAEAAQQEARAQAAEAQRLYQEAKEMVDRRLVPETRLHAAEAQKRVADAAVARLAAERRQQAEIVERHAVVAPFAGVVSQKLTEAGEWVETGTPVLELVDVRRLRLDVQVPQERFHEVALKSPVTVQLDALPGRIFEGRVTARVPVKDPRARTFLARVSVDDPKGMMTPGMSATVVFEARGAQRTLMVPRDAVVRHSDGSASVWVVEKGKVPTVLERKVQLGRTVERMVEVRQGLEPGRRVVLRGNETLKQGQAVRVVEPASARN
jgi:RND family efflux transporter MFP subunit